MLAGWEQDYPDRTDVIFKSLQQVVPSHLLDADLFDFQGLTRDTQVEEGDLVFDPQF